MKKTIFLFLILLPVNFSWAESPFDGTWKIKIEVNQKVSQGRSGLVVLQNEVFQCIGCDPEINIKADGTDQHVSPKNEEYDTMSIKVVDDKSIEGTLKKKRELIGMRKTTISADGKTSTIEMTDYHGPGKQPFVSTATYSRIAEGPPGSHEISGVWQAKDYTL